VNREPGACFSAGRRVVGLAMATIEEKLEELFAKVRSLP
jgi:hypothetical protein